MEDVHGRYKLQREVEKLTNLLQLSERKRFNQKILYDKNLENLHEKLADFEGVLNKERKEIQQILQKKEQQIKVREDLAKALQGKLDNRYCRQCGYPSSKNQFDTDWEIGIDDGKKTDRYRKLPPLSLPLPEILPNVSFSNRLSSSKSKLSPVAEECEVASSSYLRNIHADQTPDRFHAVLTASLECLQVDKASKKNITPESENADDSNSNVHANQNHIKFHAVLSASLDKHLKKDLTLENDEEDILTPTFAGLPTANDTSNDASQQQLFPRKLELCNGEDDEDDETAHSSCVPHYQPPRPSIVIESCDDLKTKKETVLDRRRVSHYANNIACSILQFAYKNAKRSNSATATADEANPDETNSSTPETSPVKAVPPISSRSLQSFSDKLALGILTRMAPDIKQGEQKRRDSLNSVGSDNSETNPLVCSTDNPKTPIACSTPVKVKCPVENGGVPIDDETNVVSPLTNGGENQPNPDYSRLSTMVVPLVDQAYSVAKSIVRRRSSTNFLVVDENINSASTIMKEKLNSSADGDDKINEPDGSSDDGVENNLSFNRKTLIELIDQAVEQVIPTDNCLKENIDPAPPPSSSLNSNSVAIHNSGTKVKSSLHRPVENRSLIVENGGGDIHNNNNNDNEDDDDDTLSTTIVSESATNQNENKENEISKSKKKKNKKKKRKKKASVCENGGCNNNKPCSDSNDVVEQLPLQQTDTATKMANGAVITSESNVLECSFDGDDVVTSSLNNSVVVETDLNTQVNILLQHDSEHDKFSLLVDQSFNEMEASRGSTPDTVDGF